MDYNNHVDRFIIVPIEYKNNQMEVFEYNFRISNPNASSAIFLLEWDYKVKDGKEGKGVGSKICRYYKDGDSFKEFEQIKRSGGDVSLATGRIDKIEFDY